MIANTVVTGSGGAAELVSGSIAYHGYATIDGAVVYVGPNTPFQTPIHSIVISMADGPIYGTYQNCKEVTTFGSTINTQYVLEVTGDDFFFR